MIRFLDSYIEPQDGTDIAPAWDRAMADTSAAFIVATPLRVYRASRAMVVTRRVVFFAWLASFLCSEEAWVFSSGGAMSAFVGAEAASVARGAGAHGFVFNARAWMMLCAAHNFGGDGFHVEADVVYYGTNANIGCLIGCASSGCDGRGFSWRGGDSNAWLAVMCHAASCSGRWTNLDGSPGAPLVGGFHDQSFLGSRIVACHSGVHKKSASNDLPLGYCMDGDSSFGVLAFSYQEGVEPLVKLRHSNIGIGNLCVYTDDSDGTTVSGRRVRGGLEFSRGDVIDATLYVGRPVVGAIAEIRSKLDQYGYSLVREPAPSTQWAIRRANMPSQTVMSLRNDTAAIAFPLGVRVGWGTQQRSITVSTSKPPTAGTIGDIVLAATPTDTLDGWRYVNSPAGPGWRAFVWAQGS